MELYKKVVFWIAQYFLLNPTLRMLKEGLRLGADSTEVFSKFFAVFNITPMGMIKERRIKYACKQLQMTTTSIPQIANEMNCRTTEHFEAEFMEGVGMTPQAYRLKMQKPLHRRKLQQD